MTVKTRFVCRRQVGGSNGLVTLALPSTLSALPNDLGPRPGPLIFVCAAFSRRSAARLRTVRERPFSTWLPTLCPIFTFDPSTCGRTLGRLHAPRWTTRLVGPCGLPWTRRQDARLRFYNRRSRHEHPFATSPQETIRRALSGVNPPMFSWTDRAPLSPRCKHLRVRLPGAGPPDGHPASSGRMLDGTRAGFRPIDPRDSAFALFEESSGAFSADRWPFRP